MGSMVRLYHWLGRASLAAAGGAMLAAAWAEGALAEQPVPWEMGLQPAATPVRERMDGFHNELLVIITLITLFVMCLLIYAMVRFNAKSHPVPSTRHPQHAPRSGVDGGADPDSRRHRDPVLQAALLRRPHRACRHDAQGHRPSMVLVATNIPTRATSPSTATCSPTPRRSRKTSPASSSSTIRWWCRWAPSSASSSPAPT